MNSSNKTLELNPDYVVFEVEEGSLVLSHDRGFLFRHPVQIDTLKIIQNKGDVQALETLYGGTLVARVCEDLLAKKIVTHSDIESIEEFEPVPFPDADGIEIVTISHYLNPSLKKTTEQKKGNWLPICLGGENVVWGPLMGPKGEQCWDCVSRRFRLNHFTGKYVDTLDFSLVPSRSKISQSTVLVKVASWLQEQNSKKWKGQPAFTFLKLDGMLNELPLRYYEACEKCGRKQHFVRKNEIAEADLMISPEHTDLRKERPEETWARISYLEGNFTGLVPTLQALKGALGEDIFIGNTAVGKGTTPLRSKIACLAEAVERHALSLWDDIEVTTIAEGMKVIEAEELMGFSPLICDDTGNYLARSKTDTNGRLDSAHKYFVECWSTLTESSVFVPATCCFFNFKEESSGMVVNSNGCATGSTFGEAVLYALLELIERDSIGVWWYNRVRYPSVDLTSFNNPDIERLLAAALHRREMLTVLDITTNLEVPTFAAIISDKDGRFVRLGTSSHLIAEQAIINSLCELNQFFSDYRMVDNLSDPILKDWLSHATISQHEYLRPTMKTKSKADYDYSVGVDGLLKIIKSLNLKGHDVIIKDLTTKNTGLYTARVFSPTLCQHRPRFGSERLKQRGKGNEFNSQVYPF